MLKTYLRLQAPPPGRWVAVLLITAGIIYAIMIGMTLPHLMELSGGRIPFDLMPGGYDVAHAEALLGALGQEGRAYYLTRQLPLDFAYPLLYTAAFYTLWLWLCTKAGIESRALRAIALLNPLAGLCDLGENVSAIRMLLEYPDLSVSLVRIGSAFTIVKSGATTLYFVCVMVLLAWLAVSALKRRLSP